MCSVAPAWYYDRRVYKYGNHLTPGLTEVRVYAAGLTSFLAGFFRAGDLAGIPALKTW